MKIEKAIEILKEQKLFTPLGQACFVAVQALEKQMPIRTIYGNGVLNCLNRCPNCKVAVENGMERFNYCPDCGQKLDWEEE